MKFNIFGHENILSLHRNTLEFTKDTSLTKQGDCIIGVKADFSYEQLMKIVKLWDKAKAVIFVDDISDDFEFYINKKFNDKHEIVIRKTDFLSDRTLGIKASKAACDINRDIIEELKKGKTALVEFIKLG